MNMKKNDLILSVKNLVVKFKTKTGIINAVRDVSFSVYKGEIVGLIGESGSGKSVTMKSIVRFNDNDILIHMKSGMPIKTDTTFVWQYPHHFLNSIENKMT